MSKISGFIFNILFINIITLKFEIKNTNIISLKFKIYYPYFNNTINDDSSFNINDYLERIHFSKLYLEVRIGNDSNFESKNQTLNIIVDLNEIIFYTTNLYFSKNTIENNNILCKYNTSESPTFYESEGYYNIYGFKTLSSYAKEYFRIYTDINLSKYNITLLNFLNTINHKTSTICGNIGLAYMHHESHSYNFISQLHSRFNLSEYSFIFNYSSINPDEGAFILGNLPHVYLPQKYNIDNLIPIYSKSGTEPLIEFDVLDLGGKKIPKKDQKTLIKISPDIEGFEFPEYYFKYFEELFFQEYYDNNICHIEKSTYRRIYSIIQCDGGENKFGNKNIKSFPKLTFYINIINNFSISFNGEDLFYVKDNNYFFKITENALEENFVLGRMLFKKYDTILNPDTKQIFFYNDIKDNGNNETNQNSHNESSINNKILIIILCLICSILFFPLGIYFGKLLFKQRKKHANELTDAYDYNPANDGNDGNEVIN